MRIELIIKRCLDISFAILIIILLSSIFLLIGIAIKINSKGPVFFTQERLGKNGKVFIIYKFRTMIVGAEHKGRGIFQEEKDDRITKIGHFLRKTSFDELPQLINILKGHMSFIGPRPPLTYYPCNFNEYSNVEKARFLFLPGISGYAQVMGRNELSWEKKIEYDIYYIQNFSLKFDFRITVRTVYKIFRREGIYQKGENKLIR